MDFPIKAEEAELRSASVEHFEPKNPEDAAKRIVDLIKRGSKPEDAAKAVGLAPEALTHNPSVVASVKQLLLEAAFTPEVQRATLRSTDFANYVRLALEFKNAPEIDLDVAEALRKQSVLLRADPEIGLTAPPMVGINIDMTPVRAVLEKLKPADQEFEFEDDKEK